MMKYIIITGAGGFVGTELTRKMVERGVHVVAVSNIFSESFPESPLIDVIETTIDEPDSLLNQIPDAEYDAFYHLAWVGVNGNSKSDPLVQIGNERMAVICAQVAKRIGCRRFLCAGTVAENSVESLPRLTKTSGGMLYGVAKHCTRLFLEAYCKNIGLPFVWMQFSNIYGPMNSTGNLVSYTLDELKKGKDALFGPAGQPYDFIFIDDLIEAVYRLGFCTANRSCYCIGSGEPRILADYLNEIGKVYGRPDLIRIGARQDDGIRYSKEMFDNSGLVEDIGEYVRYSFSDGIRKTVDETCGRAE